MSPSASLCSSGVCDVVLKQRFSIRVTLAHREHSAMSRDIFGCRDWGRGDCYRYRVGRERPGMLLVLLQALQCTGRPHTEECENPELELHDGGRVLLVSGA